MNILFWSICFGVIANLIFTFRYVVVNLIHVIFSLQLIWFLNEFAYAVNSGHYWYTMILK